MDKLSFIIISIFLLFMSFEDLKSRKIKIIYFVILIPIALGCCVLNYKLEIIDGMDIVVGMIVTVIVALFGMASKGLGMADVALIFVLGMVFGGEKLMLGMLVSFGLLYIASIVLMFKKKLKRTTMFPYIPFLSVGILLVNCL